ncbi:ABC transporter ATP-binding protein [Mycoplasma crocodyli]|uniref:Multidrug/protein/lipid ABC exporter, ATP-binding/permease protein MsbA n=1 Tax=Mycoplasma crocodyli (strain ATCC 51981 / MP145) TaxID=512564 RepID=D5E582_MYCCM|nr:ABC transporter ATP-binding protein [Mycoplasma crocodyli]ADE20023.1 multidrug/protein/lipid ABC exporter, ATP-binding/permease protein MsbA [Mycoplasma crocodyli MP145]
MKNKKNSGGIIKLIREILIFAKIKKRIYLFALISSLLLTVFLFLSSWLIGFIFDKFFTKEKFNADTFDYRMYIMFVTFLASSYILTTLFRILLNLISNRIYVTIATRLREDIYKIIQDMPIYYFETKKTGDLMSAITNDTLNLTDAINSIITTLLSFIFGFFIAFTMMYLYAPILALIVTITLPTSSFLSLFLMRKSSYYYKEQQKALGDFNGYLEEILEALPLVNLHQQSKQVKDKFEKYNSALIPNEWTSSKYWFSGWTLFNALKHVNTLLVMILSLVFFFNNIPSYGIAPFSFGTIAALSLYVQGASERFQGFIDVANVLYRGMGSWQRIKDVTNTEIEKEPDNLANLNYTNGNIEFKNLTFSYPSKPDVEVLKNINFNIKPSSTTALVGATGCGKTTLSKILSKFYLPTSGDVLIDNQSIKTTSQTSWRNHIGIIMQDTFIFEDTIKNNLKCANENVSDDVIYEATKACSLHEFIMSLEKGYDTVIKHNGSSLSEGQRQLLAIARAFIANKPIIILDEATSNIDTITELQIQKALREMMKNRTMLIIAHRLSTIKEADNIIVIDKGQIIEQGNHDKLILHNGQYANLYKTGFENK